MPKLSAHQSTKTTKLLLIGNQGTGKTGSLVSLAKAGYNLRIIDLDNGLDIVRRLLLGSPAIDNVIFETLTETMTNIGGRAQIKGTPTVLARTLRLLDHWKTDEYDLGKVTSWGPQDILVIDSLTFLSKAAMAWTLHLNGRLGQQPQIQDWGHAQTLIEDILTLLYSDAIKCNVIILSHITYIGDENEIPAGYPATLGQKLPPKVGSYFNAILGCVKKGTGASSTSVIRTRSVSNVALKVPDPSLPHELPIETGLADYFRAIRS